MGSGHDQASYRAVASTAPNKGTGHGSWGTNGELWTGDRWSCCCEHDLASERASASHAYLTTKCCMFNEAGNRLSKMNKVMSASCRVCKQDPANKGVAWLTLLHLWENDCRSGFGIVFRSRKYWISMWFFWKLQNSLVFWRILRAFASWLGGSFFGKLLFHGVHFWTWRVDVLCFFPTRASNIAFLWQSFACFVTCKKKHVLSDSQHLPVIGSCAQMMLKS